VDTIEADAQHVKLASQNIEQYRLSDRIRIHHGTFEQALPQLSEGYEMIFFDGFAPSMPILDHLRKLLTPGGVLVCADLELLTDEEMDRLEDEFANSSHWQKHTYIEDGGTAVLLKK
jgi:predicted O-methyltransferase YrrM